MLLSRDPTKQVQEVIFSERILKAPHPLIVFNNVSMSLFQYRVSNV